MDLLDYRKLFIKKARLIKDLKNINKKIETVKMYNMPCNHSKLFFVQKPKKRKRERKE